MVYLCRLNFSAAVLKISESLEVSTTAMGVVGSLFFISYALGQLVNGFIGDRVSPTYFIMIATIGTGLVNFMMSLVSNIWAIGFLWILNGYFQSIFWGTCNRLLSYYYSGKEHHLISTGMSLSMVAGYVLSWAVLGKLLLESSWQSYFLVPAVVAAFMLCQWLFFAVLENGSRREDHPHSTLDMRSLMSTMNRERLWLICCACIFVGSVKESIGLWAPVIFLNILGGDVDQSLLLIVVIPLGNLGGILLAEQLLRRPECNPYQILRNMLIAMIAFSLGIMMSRYISGLIAIFFTALVSGMALGCNSILLSFIPLSYSKQNIVATLIGIFDFSAYLGAAFSAYVLGRFLDEGSWSVIPLFWAVSALLALLLVLIRLRFYHKKGEMQNTTL